MNLKKIKTLAEDVKKLKNCLINEINGTKTVHTYVGNDTTKCI